MGFNIAIDGPAGAGKSTIAKLAAKELSFIYIDTGAMYRAIGLYVYQSGISGEDAAAVGEAALKAQVSIRYQNGERHVYLNGEDVSEKIREEHIGTLASQVSTVPAVRAHLLELQRQIAREADVIMDGRDIGTCILPDADVKIYLTAGDEVRARRRFNELTAKGETERFEKVLADIRDRDYRDMHREISPLRQAADAVLLDTSDMTIGEAVAKVVDLARKAQEKNQ